MTKLQKIIRENDRDFEEKWEWLLKGWHEDPEKWEKMIFDFHIAQLKIITKIREMVKEMKEELNAGNFRDVDTHNEVLSDVLSLLEIKK